MLEGLSLGKTLSQIASELSVGESAVSRSLSHLERLLGLQIVDRQGYRLRLTPTGRDLARAASQAVQHLRDFDELVEQYRRGEAGRLRVLSSNAPASYLLPQTINDFLERFDKAEIQLDVESAHTIWQVMAEGQHDVGIGPANEGHKHLSEQVWTSEPLYDDPVVLFVAPDNPLLGHKGVTLQSLGTHTIVGTFGETVWTQLLERLANKGLQIGRVVELTSMEGVKRLVESGQGVGIHVMSTIVREVGEGRLATLNISDISPPYKYTLVRRASQGQLSLVTAFCEQLRRRLPEVSSIES